MSRLKRADDESDAKLAAAAHNHISAGHRRTTDTRDVGSFLPAFLDDVARDRAVRIGRGQCVEQHGAGEPYMPVLEALTRLCQAEGGNRLIEILR